ncbi:MAG TPA: GAF domain-containing protein [Candidatus Paceibacterota bacterium]|nr:GAF domain-containing protein [Verrucomicrobiota bacterium]HRY47689.1 GAF domain-containing protein [Candidatus Paceibacterota bacterium]
MSEDSTKALPPDPSGRDIQTALEHVVSNVLRLESYQREIRLVSGRDRMLEITLEHLESFLPMQAAGFYFPDPVDLTFSRVTPLEAGKQAWLDVRVGQCLESGEFGWALKHPRPAVFNGINANSILVLGALRAGQRVLGMFAGLLDLSRIAAWDINTILLTTFLSRAADAIATEELGRELQANNQRLEKLVRERNAELEQNIRRLMESQQTVSRAAQAIQLLLSTQETASALGVAIDILAQALPCESVRVVCVLDPSAEPSLKTRPWMEWRKDQGVNTDGLSSGIDWNRPGLEDWQPLLASGQMVSCPTPLSTEAQIRACSEWGYRSLLLVPILSGTKWWGYLQVHGSDPPPEWTVSDLAILNTFAQSIGLAVKREQDTWELQQAKETAEVASRARNSFLTSLSREFRTPLHGILEYAQAIGQSPSFREEHEASLTGISRGATNLLALIDDLVDLHKA